MDRSISAGLAPWVNDAAALTSPRRVMDAGNGVPTTLVPCGGGKSWNPSTGLVLLPAQVMIARSVASVL